MMKSQIEQKLEGLGVPRELTAQAISLLPESVDALLLYGSRARGDEVGDSDLDLLALVKEPRITLHEGSVALSFYTEAQLMTGISSLFGAHLARDAQLLWDPSGRLAACLDGMGRVDTDRVVRRARHFAQVLGAQERDLPKYLPGLLREAKYLLRSCLYAEAIAADRACFSVREIASRYNDPRLAGLLASRPAGFDARSDLEECCARLERIIGPLPNNRHGSLEALIVNEWGEDDELVSMALLALGGSNVDADYTEVDKVLL
ncbi:nucleotidyltransferase domain-containing protein [Cellulosimicrobium sp. 72-3]|uniref:nucleotidyltransferase domain-containing protein n=1 Tax=Cellulosimicrobium sp. 72-3 TaxID=2731680 RepID=UPI00148E961C|nr:nucleotidyltransferase domain-containing protein [Cellulosimicrobium sp. 72-3]